MIRIFSITVVSIPKIPGIGDDVMLTEGIIVKMNGQGIRDLFPGKSCFTITRDNRVNYHFMANVIHTSDVIRDRQANQVSAWLIISVVRILAITIVSISKTPHIGDNVMLTEGVIGKMYG